MARTSREYLDKWFDNNVDLSNRFIYMGSTHKTDEGESGVDNFMAESFIKGIHILSTRSSEPITILMNNPGGEWYHGMAIYDAIRTSTCYCTIKVYGHAMSMGSLILQAADHRVMMPNSRFMIHYGESGNMNHSKVIEKWGDEQKKINYSIENFYLQSMLSKEEKEGHGHLAKKLSEIMTKQYSLTYPSSPPKNYSFSKTNKKEEVRMVLKEMLNFDTILDPEETIA
mgnify:CR=1 FL=1